MEKQSKTISTIKSDNFVDNQGKFSINIQPLDLQDISDENKVEEVGIETIDSVLIAEEKVNINGKFAIEGELIISKNDDCSVSIDLNGDLILSSEDEDRFEINENGELIYNY